MAAEDLELLLLQGERLGLAGELHRLVVADLLEQRDDAIGIAVVHGSDPQGSVIGEYQGSRWKRAIQALTAGNAPSR